MSTRTPRPPLPPKPSDRACQILQRAGVTQTEGIGARLLELYDEIESELKDASAISAAIENIKAVLDGFWSLRERDDCVVIGTEVDALRAHIKKLPSILPGYISTKIQPIVESDDSDGLQIQPADDSDGPQHQERVPPLPRGLNARIESFVCTFNAALNGFKFLRYQLGRGILQRELWWAPRPAGTGPIHDLPMLIGTLESLLTWHLSARRSTHEANTMRPSHPRKGRNRDVSTWMVLRVAESARAAGEIVCEPSRVPEVVAALLYVANRGAEGARSRSLDSMIKRLTNIYKRNVSQETTK